MSNVLSVYSITTAGFFIHHYLIFLHQNKNISKIAFCGLCPHPAAGIRLGLSGNTLNADGIGLGRLHFNSAAICADQKLTATGLCMVNMSVVPACSDR